MIAKRQSSLLSHVLLRFDESGESAKPCVKSLCLAGDADLKRGEVASDLRRIHCRAVPAVIRYKESIWKED
jgi:hypothetical protein